MRANRLPLLFAFVAFLLLTACQGTRNAYQAAGDPADTAKIVAEHYIAVVHELNTLKDSGELAGAQLEGAQRAVRVAKPAIDALTIAARNYDQIRSASTDAELADAIARAAEAVAKLIDIVRTVRPST